MDDSDSSLSSALSELDEEMEAKLEADVAETTNTRGIGKYFKPTPKSAKMKDPLPEPPKRAPSPPHEYVLADKDAIAFIVMFRSRFSECFAKSLPHYGPQDIENGVGGDLPDAEIEHLLCALLSLCLNRKKPVEKGHYGRALEDAVSEFKSQWPKEWNGTNALSGGKTFNTMSAEERLILLKSIILWSLHSSETVSAAIKAAYKQTRREDDRNQPKAIQPWFSDSWRRRYYLIEGQEDTQFRIYRENDGKTAKTNVWFSVAGTIAEANDLANKFETEMPGNQGKIVADKIRMAVPRWETGEEKRKRKADRQRQKTKWARPEPGFSLYEGRTRGKRTRYNYDEIGDDFVEDSSRAGSGRSTPFEDGPTYTASGRQVKSRLGGTYGESMLADQRRDTERDRATGSEDTDDVIGANGRPVRKSMPSSRAVAARGRYADGFETESETDAGAEPSGEEWSGNEDEQDDESEPDAQDDDQESGDELMDETNDEITQESLVVQLRYRRKPSTNGHAHVNGLNGVLESKGTPLREVQNATDHGPVASQNAPAIENSELQSPKSKSEADNPAGEKGTAGVISVATVEQAAPGQPRVEAA